MTSSFAARAVVTLTALWLAAPPAHADVVSPCGGFEHSDPDTHSASFPIDTSAPTTASALSSDETAIAPSADVTATRRSLACGNIWIHAELVPTFEALLQSSATVRRQVARILRARRLTVSLTMTDACVVSGARCHALTQFARYTAGGTIAQVRVQRGTRLADAIGHELEHVCEWTEGLLARTRGLRRDGQDDTDRARLAGERVHHEHARWLRTRSRASHF